MVSGPRVYAFGNIGRSSRKIISCPDVLKLRLWVYAAAELAKIALPGKSWLVSLRGCSVCMLTNPSWGGIGELFECWYGGSSC